MISFDLYKERIEYILYNFFSRNRMKVVRKIWFQIYKSIYPPEDSEVLEKILSGGVHQKFWLYALSHITI